MNYIYQLFNYINSIYDVFFIYCFLYLDLTWNSLILTDLGSSAAKAKSTQNLEIHLHVFGDICSQCSVFSACSWREENTVFTCSGNTSRAHQEFHPFSEETWNRNSFVMALQRMQFGILWWFRRYFWITPNQLLLKPAVTVLPAAESLQLHLCRKLLLSEGVQHCYSLTLTLGFCNVQWLTHIPGKKATNLLTLLSLDIPECTSSITQILYNKNSQILGSFLSSSTEHSTVLL